MAPEFVEAGSGPIVIEFARCRSLASLGFAPPHLSAAPPIFDALPHHARAHYMWPHHLRPSRHYSSAVASLLHVGSVAGTLNGVCLHYLIYSSSDSASFQYIERYMSLSIHLFKKKSSKLSSIDSEVIARATS